MRVFLSVLVLSLFAGCASVTHRQVTHWAAQVGLPPTEIRAIIDETETHHRMHVISIDRRPDGTLAVMLADHPDRPYGIIVVVKKVGAQWTEDPKQQGSWIV